MFFLFSCSLTYQYQTKDIKKSFSKYQKASEKSLKLMKSQLNDQEMILKDIVNYKPNPGFVTSLEKNHLFAKTLNADIIKLSQDVETKYKKLNLKKKNITSEDEKEYNSIKEYNEFAQNRIKQINKKLSELTKTNKTFYKLLKDEKYYLIDSASLKKRFVKAEKQFTKSYHKTSKEIETFIKKLKKSSHRNKVKMLTKAKKLQEILRDVNALKNKVKSEVNLFDQRFSKTKKILHGPGSPTYDSLKQIESYSEQMNRAAKEFKLVVKQINQMAK